MDEVIGAHDKQAMAHGSRLAALEEEAKKQQVRALVVAVCWACVWGGWLGAGVRAAVWANLHEGQTVCRWHVSRPLLNRSSGQHPTRIRHVVDWLCGHTIHGLLQPPTQPERRQTSPLLAALALAEDAAQR
jgi:hypothetical protein